MERKIIKLCEINPYNKTHGEIPDTAHRKGIDELKRQVEAGLISVLLPILVKPVKNKTYKYQRLDGYKRYVALKELGYDEVDCYVDEDGVKGGQDGMAWETSEYDITQMRFIKACTRFMNGVRSAKEALKKNIIDVNTFVENIEAFELRLRKELRK